MIWIAEVLCPEQHCLVAAATDNDIDAMSGKLEKFVGVGAEEAIRKGLLGKRCGVCQAPPDRWSIAVERTELTSMLDAVPRLSRSQAAQMATALAATGLPLAKVRN